MVLLGDVHGRWQDLVNLLRRVQVAGQDILQLGDFGLGFSPRDLEDRILAFLDGLLVDLGARLWVIRGNHDQKARWELSTVQPWTALHLVPDYTVLHLDGHSVLCVGGAISVDRRARGPASCWPDEGFVLDPDRLGHLYLGNLYAVATHTAPHSAFPREFGSIVWEFAQRDPTLLDDLRAERQALTSLAERIAERAAPRHWCYGHFHGHMVEDIGTTRYRLVDVLELCDLREDPTE
jgi:Calcineurin-like phosphoesterase